MDALTYPTKPSLVNSIPLRGKYLSRTPRTPRECDFLGSDLYRGVFHLIEPSLAQAAFLAGSHNTTAVWWAVKREDFRMEILNGDLPLVPARLGVPKTNGHARVAPTRANGESVDDVTLIAVIRNCGVERTLQAAMAVEAAL
jgi:hypothetical protein